MRVALGLPRRDPLGFQSFDCAHFQVEQDEDRRRYRGDADRGGMRDEAEQPEGDGAEEVTGVVSKGALNRLYSSSVMLKAPVLRGSTAETIAASATSGRR